MCGLPVAAEDAPPAASRFAAPRRELSLEAHVERINGALAAAKLGNPRASLAFHTRAERRMKWGAEGTFFSGLLDFCAAAKLGLKEWHGAYDLAPGGHRLVELAAEGATLSGIHPAGVLDGTRRVTFVFCHELTGDSLDLELEALFAGQAIEAERIGTGVASGEWELSIPAGAKGDLTVIVRAAGETERVLLRRTLPGADPSAWLVDWASIRGFVRWSSIAADTEVRVVMGVSRVADGHLLRQEEDFQLRKKGARVVVADEHRRLPEQLGRALAWSIDPEGALHYRCDGLEPGAHRVWLRWGAWVDVRAVEIPARSRSMDFTINPKQTASVRLDLEPDRDVYLVAADDEGKPLETGDADRSELTVYLDPGDAAPRIGKGLRPGRYVLYVDGEPRVVDLKAGENRLAVK